MALLWRKGAVGGAGPDTTTTAVPINKHPSSRRARQDPTMAGSLPAAHLCDRWLVQQQGDAGNVLAEKEPRLFTAHDLPIHVLANAQTAEGFCEEEVLGIGG